MDRRAAGFTLTELMIVITIIAILVAIVAPNLFAARSAADETRALAMLRHIVTAQSQFRQKVRADADDDGAGEYGGLAEMAGGVTGRQASPLRPAVLSGSFRLLNAAGEGKRGGYLFRMYLPDASGAGIGEPQTGYTAASGIDPDAAESVWCCYAWPVHGQGSENRTFVVNQAGEILATRAAGYAGTGAGPAADAAFTDAGSILGRLASQGVAVDGNAWAPAN